MRSNAATVGAYLAELPVDRKAAMSAVRKVIKANLPSGMVERMNWGMITYEVPLRVCPNTYNGQPLAYAALASQKQYMSVYLMGIYGDDRLRTQFEEAYRASGKRMDIGKSCILFRSLADLPLDVIGAAIGEMNMADFVALHDQAASLRRSRQSPRR